MENYDMTRAARLISDFVLDDVSNWYVRRNRRRFWKGELNEDKLSAYQTLHEVLLTVAKLIAPVAPFVSEELYLKLKSPEMPESVHLAEYPALSEDMRPLQDAALENRMRIVQQIVSIARSLRNNVRIKVRRPLQRLVVASPSKTVRDSVLETADVIKEEINVKQVDVIENASKIVLKRAKPHYKRLGPKAGKLMKMVTEIIENLNEDSIRQLETSGELTLDVEGSQIHVLKDDVELYEEIREENLVVERDGQILVALDTHITLELEKEGIAREFINRVQNLRKEAGFEVTDRILISYQAEEKIRNAIEELSDYIMTETLSTNIQSDGINGEVNKDLKIDNMSIKVSLKRK
jgi:isoleucyl-tRNA synthetase